MDVNKPIFSITYIKKKKKKDVKWELSNNFADAQVNQ